MFETNRRNLLPLVVVVWMAISRVALADDSSIVTGKHFRVICDFKNRDVANSALETAEAVWPRVMETWGIDSGKARKPLRVYLYQTFEAYEAAEAKRTGGRFRENLSFSHRKDKSAHVMVQPGCSDEVLARVGLPGLTRMLIAHECSHLATYATIPNHSAHPEWLTEGFATFVATRTLEEKGWIGAAEDDPFCGAMLMRVWRMKQEGKFPLLHDLIADGCKGFELQDRYAVYWLFFRFMQHPELQIHLGSILAQSREMKSTDDFAARYAQAVTERLGGPDALHQIDRQLQNFASLVKPKWDEQYRSMEMRKDEWVQIAFPQKKSTIFSRDQVQASSYSIEGSVEILANGAPKAEVSVYLGQRDIGILMVNFSPNSGIGVVRQIRAENRQEMLATAKSKAIKLGKRVRFKVVVSDGELEVLINNKSRLNCSLGEHDGTGLWGLGTTAGNAAIWRDVRVNITMKMVEGD